jgi:hypothetical protein
MITVIFFGFFIRECVRFNNQNVTSALEASYRYTRLKSRVNRSISFSRRSLEAPEPSWKIQFVGGRFSCLVRGKPFGSSGIFNFPDYSRALWVSSCGLFAQFTLPHLCERAYYIHLRKPQSSGTNDHDIFCYLQGQNRNITLHITLRVHVKCESKFSKE